MADPYKDNVVLYLPMEGSRDGDTVILDKTGKTVTVNGNTHLSTDVVPPFGTMSAYFGGTDDSLSVQTVGGLDFFAADFTIECWVRLTNYSSTRIIVGLWDNATAANCGFLYGISSSGNIFFDFRDSDGSTYRTTAGGSFASYLNVWTHVAVVRRGDYFYHLINGVLSAAPTSMPYIINEFPFWPKVGAHTTSTSPFLGYIKDLRITKGVARYTGNFSPSQTTTVDDADWANVVLAIHGEGTGTTFTDVSNSAKTITTNGDTTHSTAVAPPFGTSSAYFDGTGDYLSLADSADWELDAGDFTIEMWVRPASGSPADYQGLVSHEDQLGGSVYGWLFITDNSNADKLRLTLRSGGSTYGVVGNALTGGVWQHVAATRQNGVVRLFQDGIKTAEDTVAVTVTNNSQPLRIGALSSNSSLWAYFNGYIKDLRITKGVARYTQDFVLKYVPFPDKTAIKTIAKPVDWDEPEQPRSML